ncbi:MAG: YifB family Mg chelatase-like AAA ATPase, partial [Frankiaceae bacterium]|nr:YifB family Mg chelatase-like AAA ATPase [Frankiaceae bacterium]
DAMVRESANRVKSAMGHSGEHWPARKVTVALLPASVRKTGSGFDLAVAIAVLAAQRSFEPSLVRDVVMIGELGLDGRLCGVTGVLPAVIGAVRAGYSRVVVPRANAPEARLVPGAAIQAVGTLAELCAILRGDPVDVEPVDLAAPPVAAPPPDLADVVGQSAARHAIEVAAAGGHHLLMTGPPGVGKTMLAERLPGILPDLTDGEALEVSSIHSLMGRLPAGQPLITRPPFYAPHHSATLASLVGGGIGLPRPGLISLAHRGLLFLDEAVEFGTKTLEALRQPLESGEVTITRASSAATFPARFQLVLAANPCACARGGRVTDAASCRCSSSQLRQYQNKLSGPLLDRIDLRTRFEPISRAILDVNARGEATAAVRERVMAARERASWRLEGTPWTTNAQVPGPEIRSRWPLQGHVVAELQLDMDRGKASNRGIDRILKISWTLADLGGRGEPNRDDVELARHLRFTSPEDAAAELRRSA